MSADTPNEIVNYQYKEFCMTWFAENWFWLLFGVGFIAMHFFGHGCHSGHGSHGGSHGEGGAPPKKKSDAPGARKRPDPTHKHRH